MRKIGTLPDPVQARRFVAFLGTQQISAEVREGAGALAVWVHQEEAQQVARELLSEFLAEPDAKKFVAPGKVVGAVEASRKKPARARPERSVVKTWNWRAAGTTGVTITLILIAGLVYLMTYSEGKDEAFGRLAQFLRFTPQDAAGDLGLRGIFERLELWRLVSPIFLHASRAHIFFNAYMLFVLGTQVEMRIGPVRFLSLVIAVAVVSNTCQYLNDTPLFGGLSGVVYGLVGFIWMKMRFQPNLGFYIAPQSLLLLIVWLFVCLFSPEFANTAHFTGLAVGMATSALPELLRRP